MTDLGQIGHISAISVTYDTLDQVYLRLHRQRPEFCCALAALSSTNSRWIDSNHSIDSVAGILEKELKKS